MTGRAAEEFLVAVAALLGLVWLVGPGVARADEPCLGRGTALLVSARSSTLTLCRGERAEGSYRVALGRGGVGKERSGDDRTPIGTYGLRAPRPSAAYGIFIAVDYPTDEQRKAGYTGSDIGVHGPPRNTRWLGKANTWMDVTRGCIMVSTDEEIRQIAAWVRLRRVQTILIER